MSWFLLITEIKQSVCAYKIKAPIIFIIKTINDTGSTVFDWCHAYTTQEYTAVPSPPVLSQSQDKCPIHLEAFNILLLMLFLETNT